MSEIETTTPTEVEQENPNGEIQSTEPSTLNEDQESRGAGSPTETTQEGTPDPEGVTDEDEEGTNA